MKRIALMLSLLFVVALLAAKPVDISTAVQVAENLMLERGGRSFTNSSGISLESPSRQSRIYVINLVPEGFVVVAGDDAANPILGYSLEGKWGEQSMPVQLTGMLNNWLEQMDFISSHALPASLEISSAWARYAVPSGSFVA